MPRTWRAACVGTFLLAPGGCGGSTAAPSAPPALHGEVSDPVDALSDSRVPVCPQLVHATADVAAGSITFVMQFAPGTLDRSTTWVDIELDTDQDSSTGIRQRNGMGADCAVLLVASTGSAAIQKADAVACAAHLPCHNTVDFAPIIFLADGMPVTVPLLLLGSVDGRMFFQLETHAVVAQQSPICGDWMPDESLPPGRVQ